MATSPNCIAPADPAVPGMASIVMLTFNKWEYTGRCLESLFRNTDCPFELVVVDNASADSTVENLRRLYGNGINLIANTANSGFPAGCNQGARSARGDFLVFLNNDTLLPPGWLGALLNRFRADPAVGGAGPMTNHASNEQLLPEPADRAPEAFDRASADRARGFAGQSLRVRKLIGFCMAVSRKAWEECGPFDEGYGIGNFEDDDLCASLEQKGYASLVALDVYVHHFVGQGFASLPGRHLDLCRANAYRFLKKWGNAYRDWPGLKGFLYNLVSVALPGPFNAGNGLDDILRVFRESFAAPHLITVVRGRNDPGDNILRESVFGSFQFTGTGKTTWAEQLNCAWVHHAAEIYACLAPSAFVPVRALLAAGASLFTRRDFGTASISAEEQPGRTLFLFSQNSRLRAGLLDRRFSRPERALADFRYRMARADRPNLRLTVRRDGTVTEETLPLEKLKESVPGWRRMYISLIRGGKIRISRKNSLREGWIPEDKS